MLRFLTIILALLLNLSLAELHASQTSSMKSIEQDVQDAVITTKITAWYAKDKVLNPLKISVNTKNGVVTLSGYVKSKQAFVDALRIAKTTKGVKSVVADDLEIKKVNTAFTDAYITTKVEAAILKAKVLDDESIPLVGINATTNNGAVTLTGTLKSDQAIGAILKRVSLIKGVKKVISHLTVQEDSK